MNLRSRLNTYSASLRSSYWFLPAVGAVLAVALWYAADRIDRAMGDLGASWIYGGSASGARTLVGAVASSTITVAGVVFSITIVTLSLASQQFGPRLLRTFMRDVGNQVVLATFIGTFLYSLLVLREIRGTNGGAEFVPGISVTVAVFLALLSVAVLVYFIHHTARSIQADRITSVVGRDLTEGMKSLFPGDVAGRRGPVPEFVPDEWPGRVEAGTDGYVLSIDVAGLASAACGAGRRVSLAVRPGQFVTRAQPIAHVDGASSDAQCKEMLRAVVIGPIRSEANSDIEGVIDQLGQIALRALSPSLNDPYTAIQCIDWLAAAFGELARQGPQVAIVEDSGGEDRVFIRDPLNFEQLLRRAFDPLRYSAMAEPTVADALMHSLERLVEDASAPAYGVEIARLARRMYGACELRDDDKLALAGQLRLIEDAAVAAGAGRGMQHDLEPQNLEP